jgi:hypothetical protein
LAGGFSRAVTYLNYPGAVLAIALAWVASARLFTSAGLDRRGRRIVAVVTTVAIVLCLVTAFPGVVKQSDLDARPVNALPAIGVLLALGLSIAALRMTPPLPAWRWTRMRVAGAIGAGIVTFITLPYILADLGIYIGDIPLLGDMFMSKQIPVGHTLPAIHLGHHHGLDGALFAIAGLALLRPLRELSRIRLRPGMAAYLALLIVYGLANFIEDSWGEQIVKRGWTDRGIPNVIRPELSLAWGLILLGAAVVWLIVLRVLRTDQRRTVEGAG